MTGVLPSSGRGSGTLGRLTRASLLPLCTVLVLAGAALLVAATDLPAFSDPQRAADLLAAASPDDWEATEAMQAELDGLVGPQWAWREAGRGLVALGLSLAGIWYWVRRHGGDPRALTTPATTRRYMLLTLVFFVGYTVASSFALADLSHRMVEGTFALELGQHVLLHGLWLLGLMPLFMIASYAVALVDRPLPVGLWIWDAGRPRRSWIWTAGAGLIGLAMVRGILGAAIEGPSLHVPVLLVGLYLVLSFRALMVQAR